MGMHLRACHGAAGKLTFQLARDRVVRFFDIIDGKTEDLHELGAHAVLAGGHATARPPVHQFDDRGGLRVHGLTGAQMDDLLFHTLGIGLAVGDAHGHLTDRIEREFDLVLNVREIKTVRIPSGGIAEAGRDFHRARLEMVSKRQRLRFGRESAERCPVPLHEKRRHGLESLWSVQIAAAFRFGRGHALESVRIWPSAVMYFV